MATEDTIISCAAHYRERLDFRPGTPESLQQATRSRLDQIIDKAGAKRRSDPLLARIDEAFAEAGIVTFPSLTDPHNRPDERIYLFDRDHQMEGLAHARQSFRNQAALRDFILDNRHQFEALRGLSEIKPEAKMASGRRLDLMAKRPRRNQLVGIELKLDEADDRAVGQSQHYIDDLVKEAEKHGAEPHFMLIAGGQPNKSVRTRIESYAKTRGVGVTFLLHQVEMSLRLHP